MHLKSTKLISTILGAGLIFVSFSSHLQAVIVQSAKVEGNQRIDRDTILAQVDFRAGKDYDSFDLDKALSSLFRTGYFADAHVHVEGQTLVINVTENPIVNQMVIEGNSAISDDILKPELQLKPRQVYTVAKLKEDTQKIQDYYRLKGYFAAVVKPQIIRRDQNRVDVIFEVEEGEATVVRKIFFIGNKQFSEDKLESTIQTKESRWYRFFTTDDNYDPDRIAYDRELLRKFYLEHGYADFQVKSAVAELTPDQKEFFITFTLHEGERYKVGEIEITSQIPKIDPEILKKHVKFAAGDWYNNKDVESTVKSLTEALGALGYAFVDIQPNLTKDQESKKVKLNFVIQEGPKVYIDKILIEGNDRTDEEVLRREFEIHEGDPYNTNKVKNSERNVKDTGFFKKVTVMQEPSDAPDKANIKVNVEEDRTGELQLGAGFSTADGPLANIQFAEHNFRGKGQDLRAAVTWAKRKQEFDIGFMEPYFMGKDLAASVDLYRITSQKYRDQAFNEEQHGVGFSFGYKLSEHIVQTVGYGISFHKLSNIDSTASRLVREQEGRSTKSRITHDISYDRRDSKLNPTMGWYVGMNNELAGLGGTVKYSKNVFRAGYYYPLSDDWVLSLSGRYGFMAGLGKRTRIADRFILGGDSLRGFEVGGVSPRDRGTREPLGGHQFYSASAELNFPVGLPNEFGVKGALFADAGSVWQSKESGPEVYESKKLRASLGGGLRWRSPLGPISIDLAQAISKDALDKTQLIFFGFKTRF